jgi:hypothetical protein
MRQFVLQQLKQGMSGCQMKMNFPEACWGEIHSVHILSNPPLVLKLADVSQLPAGGGNIAAPGGP